MSIWSDEVISFVAAEAENEIANELKCITKRISLDVRARNSLYAVPSDCISIRRVTWNGKKLEPRHFRGILKYPVVDPAGVVGAFYSEAFSNAFYVDASDSKPESGTPYLYFYSGFGENVIKLFPTPSANLPASVANLFGEAIATSCIVEYYTFPDLTGNTYRLPVYIARRIIKAFVLSKLYMIEGPGQDIEGAGRHKARFFALLNDFRRINSGIFVSRTFTRTPQGGLYPTIIGRPRLPSNFGTFVED